MCENFHFGSSKRKRAENKNMEFYCSHGPCVLLRKYAADFDATMAEVYYSISRILGNQLIGNYWFCDDNTENRRAPEAQQSDMC